MRICERVYACVYVWCFVRRKRAANIGIGEDMFSSPLNVTTLYISNDRITSPYSAEPPPDNPLHEDDTFPTPDGISEQTANELCRDAVEQSDLYDICLSYTAIDTEQYVRSCVEDIKV